MSISGEVIREPVETLLCNQCGECCRQGGACSLRGESWTQRKVALNFQGACEFLEGDKCSVMLAVIKQNGSDAVLRRYMGLNGLCDCATLRKPRPGD